MAAAFIAVKNKRASRPSGTAAAKGLGRAESVVRQRNFWAEIERYSRCPSLLAILFEFVSLTVSFES